MAARWGWRAMKARARGMNSGKRSSRSPGKTVEAHRANMMKKMRVSNTAQLLKTAIQGNMIRIR